MATFNLITTVKFLATLLRTKLSENQRIIEINIYSSTEHVLMPFIKLSFCV